MFIKCVLEFAFCKGKGSAFYKPTITGDQYGNGGEIESAQELKRLGVQDQVIGYHRAKGPLAMG